MVFSPNILKAIQSATGEVARPCHYVVFIMPPPALILAGPIMGPIGAVLSIAGSAAITMMAESASIPGKQFATTPFTMYGTTMKMPYGTLYDDFNVTFMCSKSMAERTFFDLWASYIHNPHNNNMNYLDTYTSSIVVVKVNDVSILEDTPTVSLLNAASVWQLDKCYPVTIAAQELSYAADDYLRLSVQFAYRKWCSGVDLIANAVLPGPGTLLVVPETAIYVTAAIELIKAVLVKATPSLKLGDDKFGLNSKKPTEDKIVANPDAKFKLNSNKK